MLDRYTTGPRQCVARDRCGRYRRASLILFALWGPVNPAICPVPSLWLGRWEAIMASNWGPHPRAQGVKCLEDHVLAPGRPRHAGRRDATLQRRLQPMDPRAAAERGHGWWPSPSAAGHRLRSRPLRPAHAPMTTATCCESYVVLRLSAGQPCFSSLSSPSCCANTVTRTPQRRRPIATKAATATTT
jgi:hypothetical protein